MPTSYGFGSRFRQWRKAQGLTQQELASKIGISQSYLGLVETGKRMPSGQLLSVMAAHFGAMVVGLLLEGDRDTDKTIANQSAAASASSMAKNPHLQEFLNDKDLIEGLKLSPAEIQLLTTIEIEPNLPDSKGFYINILIAYRHHRLKLAEKKAGNL